MTPQNLRLSIFNSIKDNRPRTLQRNLDLVIKSLTTPIMTDSKDSVPLWSPTIFNGNRSKANAQEIGFLVFDLDDGIAPIDCWRLFSDVTVIYHSSFSHKPQHHKYRIILPLEDPIAADQWYRASQAARQMWDSVVGRGEPDPKPLKNSAAIYYRYSIPNAYGVDMGSPINPLSYHQAGYHLGEEIGGAPLMLSLSYDHIEEEKPREPYKAAPRANGKYDIDDLMMDSNFRMSVASRMGATIAGDEAKYIICPSCGKNSVHFAISMINTDYKWASCNHQKTCKWYGSLNELLGEAK